MFMEQKLCRSLIFSFSVLKKSAFLVQSLLNRLGHGHACVLMAGNVQKKSDKAEGDMTNLGFLNDQDCSILS